MLTGSYYRAPWVFWRVVKGFVYWMGWQVIYLTSSMGELGNLTMLARFFRVDLDRFTVIQLSGHLPLSPAYFIAGLDK